jgi:hypothetical protein
MTTQEQIQANLIALGFDNTSVAALYNQIAQAVALPLDNTLTEINDAINVITNLLTTKNYGKANYYTGKALAFQYGDDLVTDPATFDEVYATVDTSKQIIAQAAFEEIVSGSDSELFLKVATEDVNGNLIGLNSAQLAAFESYFSNFELPGLPISIKSPPTGNVLNFSANATYYKSYDLTTLQANTSSALTAFREGFAFDGVFYAGDLQDYIKQNVPGMRDFYLYSTLLDGTPFSGSQTLSSGYFNYADNLLNQIFYAAV